MRPITILAALKPSFKKLGFFRKPISLNWAIFGKNECDYKEKNCFNNIPL